MARARNIKPALFKNEILGVADPLITILFESLWCLADREGRLEDRPLRIKAETFPYRDGVDVNGYLTELQRSGFIQRYIVNGLALIQIVNFKKHQTPHKTEKPSILPGHDENSVSSQPVTELTVKQPLSNGEETAALPPDLLIPDSLNLIPDSKTNCAEPLRDSTPPVIAIPLVDKSEYQLYESQVVEWESAYPAVNVRQKLREIRQWNIANPTRRKTRKGILRHVTDWLAKEQNRGGVTRETHQPIDNSAIGQIRAANERARQREAAERRANAATVGAHGDDVRPPLEGEFRTG